MKLEKSKSSGVFSLSQVNVPDCWLSDSASSSKASEGELTDKEKAELVRKHLLRCDYNRFGFQEYENPRLDDLSQGHWELWDNDDESGEPLQLPSKFVARNPALDIRPNCVVGIDFGTKSTVVVRLEEDGKLKPVRIGLRDLFKASEAHHYENPTCIEFRDVKRFDERYKAKQGRPETRWEWLTISHSAVESLLNSESKDMSSFLNELKQWAGTTKGRQNADLVNGSERLGLSIPMRDKQGFEWDIKPYEDITEEDMDPIQIYAYLLGLNINNMLRKICMKYLLSYPVTYTVQTRDRLKRSFELGLRQSLPSALLKNDAAMQKFSVEFGASEPAAYAVCALKQYGFEPGPGERIRYGVFDFGGGTTDFDFGIWRAADPENRAEKSYSYVITHYNTNGDPQLGGENILMTMAFETFKQNKDLLRERHVSFTEVYGCDILGGDKEVLIAEDGNARKNMKSMCEELRALWECQEDYEAKYESGMLKVDLWDRNGTLLSGIDLEVDMQKLERIIVSKIDNGVDQFFSVFKSTFADAEFNGNNNKVEIFLAGNSCKSQRVIDSFHRHIKEVAEELKQNMPENECPEGKMEDIFDLFPPLGTEEAIKVMRERGLTVDENDTERPTGKTGVAFGLLMARDSDDVKVEHKGKDAFLFFVGEKDKKYFSAVLKKGCEMGTWVALKKAADSSTIELYYTTLADAEYEKTLPIGEARPRHVDNPLEEPDGDLSVFIRAVDPRTIELIVAEEDDTGQPTGEVTGPVSIVLSE